MSDGDGGGDVRERFLRMCAEDIERTGWSAFSVVGEPVTFTYTIGLSESYQHPELVLLGLEPGPAHRILAGAVRHVQAGRVLGPNEDVADCIIGYDARFAPVPERYLGGFYASNERYGREVPRLQLIWPDERGVFPGEPGCDPADEAAQSLERLLGSE